ncbi:hypothetical protein DVH05_024533 [Phytophthora capsici]|nr:hypothetical protein DVH05_024533 [Phytophthora capsici]
MMIDFLENKRRTNGAKLWKRSRRRRNHSTLAVVHTQLTMFTPFKSGGLHGIDREVPERRRLNYQSAVTVG